MVISQEQLNDRRQGIGSSDAPAILGLSKYKSPYDVWLDKTGKIQNSSAGQAAWIGNMLEDAILGMAAQSLGKKVVAADGEKSTTFIKGLLRANVDGMIDVFQEGSPIVEVKTTGQLADWGDAMTDSVPSHVLVQIHHQMLCTKSQMCYVARLGAAFGFSFDIFPVRYDEAFAKEMESEVLAWWDNHVVKDIPPSIESGVPNLELLKSMSRKKGKTIILPESLFVAEREAKEAAAAAELLHNEAKAVLMAAMGDATVATCIGYKAGISTITSKRFDSARFSEENPDMALKYQKDSSYQRFDIRSIKS